MTVFKKFPEHKIRTGIHTKTNPAIYFDKDEVDVWKQQVRKYLVDKKQKPKEVKGQTTLSRIASIAYQDGQKDLAEKVLEMLESV